jgi:hypothetical protein
MSVGVLIIGLVAATAGYAVVKSLEAPGGASSHFTRDDDVRAQQKIVDLARRRPHDATVVLSEAELNAFVSRHLDPADLPLRDTVLRLLGDDRVELAGTTPVGRLLQESPLAPLTPAVPSGWLARPVWLTIGAHATIATEPRRALRLDVRRVVIGRQRVPAVLLRLLLDPSSLRLMRITLPPEVRTVRIERGRVLIETTSLPPRT